TTTNTSDPATITINQAVPTFSNLPSASMTYRDPSGTLTGRLSEGTLVPSGDVSVTVGVLTQSTALDDNGDFSFNLDAQSLGAAGSPYKVSYSFAGNTDFQSALDTSTSLTVNKATPSVTVTGSTFTYDGQKH